MTFVMKTMLVIFSYLVDNVLDYILSEWIFKTTNKKITNLIHHEYIEWSFLFNRNFMQWSKFHIFMIEKFGLPNMLLSE